MRHPGTSVVGGLQATMAPSLEVEVSDFGPIKSGTLNVRPLTVFVGPSNSGKTYLAVLLYALSECLGGFAKFPGPLPFPTRGARFRVLGGDPDEEWADLAKKLVTAACSIQFEDLPERIRTRTQSGLEFLITDKDGLSFELKRCFDIDCVSELVRWQTDAATNARISVTASDGDRPLWWFELGIPCETPVLQKVAQSVAYAPEQNSSDPTLQFRGKLDNIELMLPKIGTFEADLFSYLRKTISISSGSEKLERINDAIREILMYNNVGGRAHYLPAARSGIMQSHRVIASSLFLRATRAGFERMPELPTFSGIVADFMEKLILNGDQDRRYPAGLLRNRYDQMQRHIFGDPERENVAKIAAALEQTMLAGSIRTRNQPNKTYPDFVYTPNQSNLQLRMARSSSMVSELAPIVLFLRQLVVVGDMVIIEEPEAHLHPAAQTRMALVLAKLARAGVRVLITTHSDWLLKQIGNLIRQGESETVSGSMDEETGFSSSLLPEDVGVWLFRNDGSTTGSTIEEIPYDRIDGIEPAEYADVEEELYNRSADLQNFLDNRENGGIF